MFTIGYVLAIVVALIPALSSYASTGHFPAIPPRRVILLAAIVLGIVGLEAALRISLDYYWFTELGKTQRFLLALYYRAAIFFVVAIAVGWFVGANLSVMCRSVWPFAPALLWVVALVFAIVLARFAVSLWIPLLAYLGATDTGITDPVFGRDLSFYLLQLPLYQDVIGGGIFVLLFLFAVWGAANLLSGGSPGAPARPVMHPRGSTALAHFLQNANWIPGAAHAPASIPRRRAMLLAALLCIALAVSRMLDRYHLVVDGHSKVLAGASFADIHFWIPGYDLTIAAWLALAGLLIAAALVGRVSAWFAAQPTRWLVPCGLFVLAYFGAYAVPVVLEEIYVGPNQITLEQPYLTRSIAGTRRAFNLDAPALDEREFAVSADSLTAADLKTNAATLRDIRIWDWRALEPQLQQIQGLRPYYRFSGVDIDRYIIDGSERQVMITARELDVDRLPEPAKVWVNLALKYTHGYGAVVVPVNEIDARGNPVLWARDIPIRAKDGLAVTHGQIYFGEATRERVYVHTTEQEFDFPQGQANVEATYAGEGGIAISDLWRKIVIAHQVDGLRLFISQYFTPDSRILLRRNIVERAQTLAPFLTFDRDPYIVADGDHYSYILDAYTSSDSYPYSQAYDGSVRAFYGQNYLRNSVKAVIDAYNGSVTFYVFDRHDPIINAYRRMLPGFFKDAAEMPASLRRHIRYPEDLFTVQAEMYGTYHMTNPMTFYNREDRWDVPRELFRDREIEMRPYYVTSQLPAAARPEFMLMLPMAVAGKNQMAGWLAGLCDGENYGKLVAFRFPKGTFIDGPAQIEARINADSRFSGNLTLWDQHGSQVIRGNLIVLPLGSNQLIALEPIYIEAEQTRIPVLARVVLGQLLPDNRRIEWAPTLNEAEELLVGTSLQPPAAAAQPAASGLSPDTLAQARDVFEEMKRQYAGGNFARYGELLQQLGKLLAPPQR
jgi:uncharacterized membrane protein (UPF0182 family)